MNRQQGFSLLELMVAVFIFAVAIAGFFNVMGQSARHAGYLENKYFAELLAHNHLVELSLLNTPPEHGHTNGKQTIANHAYQWTQVVEATQNTDIRKVNLKIKGDSGAQLSELNLFVGVQP